MNVVEMVKARLAGVRADGLVNTELECGCGLDDFYPCGTIGMACRAALCDDDGDGMFYAIGTEDAERVRRRRTEAAYRASRAEALAETFRVGDLTELRDADHFASAVHPFIGTCPGCEGIRHRHPAGPCPDCDSVEPIEPLLHTPPAFDWQGASAPDLIDFGEGHVVSLRRCDCVTRGERCMARTIPNEFRCVVHQPIITVEDALRGLEPVAWDRLGFVAIGDRLSMWTGETRTVLLTGVDAETLPFDGPQPEGAEAYLVPEGDLHTAERAELLNGVTAVAFVKE